jgi:short-subunit dehydrogenase
MRSLTISAIDAWISRRARPKPEALEAVRGLSPAVVITGASRGIGLALARRFAKAGSAVAMIARDQSLLAGMAEGVQRDFNVKAIPIALDITAEDAPAALDAAVAAAGLYTDTLVNNAGIGIAGPFHTQSEEQLERLIALNITALTRLTRHVLPSLRARARGGILNIASLGGLVPGPHQAAYYASKAYVISLTEAIRHEVRGEGVRVAVAAPGPVQTTFHRAMGAEGSLYRLIIPAMEPEAIAASAYRGYRLGRTVIVPGVLGTIGGMVLRVAPHTLTVPLVGRLLQVSTPETDQAPPRESGSGMR